MKIFGNIPKLMLNPNDVYSIRSTMSSLADEYEKIHESNVKLYNDCEQVKKCIENQIQQIKEIRENFEKLRQEFINNDNKIPLLNTEISNIEIKQETINNENENGTEVDYEIKTLVSSKNIPHPQNIVLIADIEECTVVCCTSFSPDGSLIAIGSDKTLRVYNIDKDFFSFEQSLDHSSSTNSNHVRSISWTNDSKCIICGTEDSKIRIYQIQDEILLKKIKVGTKGIFEIEVSPNDDYFAVVNGDGCLNLYSMQNNYEHIKTFDRKVEDVIALSLSISEDGSLIAVGYSDYSVCFWDRNRDRCILESKCHDGGIFSIKFIPGKKNRFITSSLDSKIKFWELVFDTNGQPRIILLNILTDHTKGVLSLAINKDGTWLLSGSKDTTAKLTDIESATMIYDIHAHKNSVISVSFSPRNKHFCTGSGDHSIKIWELK